MESYLTTAIRNDIKHTSNANEGFSSRQISHMLQPLKREIIQSNWKTIEDGSVVLNTDKNTDTYNESIIKWCKNVSHTKCMFSVP